MVYASAKWDMDLDFLEVKTILENSLNGKGQMLASIMPRKLKIIGKQFLYDSILYIQLMNASRIMEAKEILVNWLNTGKDRFDILAEKTKLPRPTYVPNTIKKRKVVYDLYRSELESITKYAIVQYTKRTYQWNTHALRYATIRYLIQKGVRAEIIRALLGHKRIEQTVAYAQKIDASGLFDVLEGEKEKSLS
jgi:hypothetical protein